jgi:hypothetical protein
VKDSLVLAGDIAMTQRFECEELDSASLEYLRTAHRHKGDGLPGIYLDHRAAQLAGAWLPTAGGIIGLVLVPLTLWCTWGSLDDPVNTAMLQTAGLFLGGWLVVAWIRQRTARSRTDYIGFFKLIDPLYLWHASGRGVWVTPLSDLRDADLRHKYNNHGNYTTSQVLIRLRRDELVIDVRPQGLAEVLEEYLNLLPDSRSGTPADRGFAILEELDRREADQDGVEPPPPIRRQVDAIPEPHKVRTVRNWWPYPIVVVLLILTFFWSKSLCTALRDDEIFDLVRDRPAPDLRAYLIDRRNTRHRTEVMQRLARVHDQKAMQIEARGGDPQLIAGLASLIRAVGHQASPMITLSVRQSQDADERDRGTLFAAEQMQRLRKDLIAKLTAPSPTHGLPSLFGTDMTDYGEVEEGPAMIEIASKATRLADRPGYRIDWTVTLQASEDAAKFVWKTQTMPPPGAAGHSAIALQGQYNEFPQRFDQALTAR